MIRWHTQQEYKIAQHRRIQKERKKCKYNEMTFTSEKIKRKDVKKENFSNDVLIKKNKDEKERQSNKKKGNLIKYEVRNAEK